jgi:hypothetical protein
VIGQPTAATAVPDCLYDPENLRVRA